MIPNDYQVGGSHYKSTYQPWDFTIDVFGSDFFLGSANKYLTRWKRKGGVEDLNKARHYLDKFRLTTPSLGWPWQTPTGATALLAHYVACNDIGLMEEAILKSMMKGQIGTAISQLDRLIHHETLRDSAQPGQI